MKRSRTLALLATTACALAGCGEIVGDDDGPGSPICQVVGNGSHVSTSSSPSGQFDNPVLAFDGHLESYAAFGPGQAATGTISGGGLSRPGEEFAGVALTRPRSGAITVNINTYRNGVLQESRQAGSVNYTPTGDASTCPGYCLQRNNEVFLGIYTLLAFDTIEAQFSISGMPEPLQVRELCVI